MVSRQDEDCRSAAPGLLRDKLGVCQWFHYEAYTDLERAKHVVLVSFEPEDESPIVFLRLRKAVRSGSLKVTTLAPFASRGTEKLAAHLVKVAPGGEAAALEAVDFGENAIVLVGERAGGHPGLLSAVAAKADAVGARLAWVPRRAGDIGAIEAGCLPTLLPGGRPVSDAAARVDVAAAWGAESLPSEEGLCAGAQYRAVLDGGLKALVVAGVDPYDMADSPTALAGLEAAEFVVSIEQRQSAVTERADVVFPAALLEEQAGHFLNWEHREGPVSLINKSDRNPMTDLRILAALADAMGRDLGMRSVAQARRDYDEIGPWEGSRIADPATPDAGVAGGGVLLAGWRELLDASSGNDHELALRATARPAGARVSVATAEKLGIGDVISVTAGDSNIVVPVIERGDMVDDVVWLPLNPGGERLNLRPGEPVSVAAVTIQEGASA